VIGSRSNRLHTSCFANSDKGRAAPTQPRRRSIAAQSEAGHALFDRSFSRLALRLRTLRILGSARCGQIGGGRIGGWRDGAFVQLRRKVGDIGYRNHDPKLVCHFPKFGGRRAVLNIVRKTQEGVDVIEKIFGRQHDAPPSLVKRLVCQKTDLPKVWFAPTD